MIVSTRGRYALRVLVDLAEHQGDGYIPLRDITARQEISQKYLEGIMATLSKAGLVTGVHGKGGGYRLSGAPEECTIGRVLRLTEGSLAPVACLEQDAPPCARSGECRTLPVWERLNTLISDYLDSVTLRELMRPAE